LPPHGRPAAASIWCRHPQTGSRLLPFTSFRARLPAHPQTPPNGGMHTPFTYSRLRTMRFPRSLCSWIPASSKTSAFPSSCRMTRPLDCEVIRTTRKLPLACATSLVVFGCEFADEASSQFSAVPRSERSGAALSGRDLRYASFDEIRPQIKGLPLQIQSRQIDLCRHRDLPTQLPISERGRSLRGWWNLQARSRSFAR